MKHYLAFGGGVNSVALYLLMEKLGMGFEAVFVNHGGDWPETYSYVDYFIGTGRPITILKPDVNTIEGVRFDDIADYCEHRKILPSRIRRWCTDRFKVRPMNNYIQTPCFMHLGIDAGEAGRARMSSTDGVEHRFMLIEHNIDREGCVRFIQDAGLKVPSKSGCYLCPFQKTSEFKRLRKQHPDLFCRVQKMEETQNSRVTKDGKPWKPQYLIDKPLKDIVSDSENRQKALPGMEDLEYPPCQCGL